MPTPTLCPSWPESRARAYPAGTATTSVITTTMAPTKAVFSSQRTYCVWWKMKVTWRRVGDCPSGSPRVVVNLKGTFARL